MMNEVITFQLPEGITRNDVIKYYEDTTDKWRNINELIRKSCIYDEEARLGVGIYHSETTAAADQWHDAEWCKFVKELYGSDPVVRRFGVPIVADNELDQTITFSINEAS